MACGFINLQHIGSESNVSDILSKHWGYQTIRELLNPIFYFKGNTGDLYYNDNKGIKGENLEINFTQRDYFIDQILNLVTIWK